MVGKKHLTRGEYTAICKYIKFFHGPAVDCQIDMVTGCFKHIEGDALKSILRAEWRKAMKKIDFGIFRNNVCKQLKRFEDNNWYEQDRSILLKFANMETVNPLAVCRIVLNEKYKLASDAQKKKFLVYPLLIPDDMLAANVMQCIVSDIFEGPNVELKRQVMKHQHEMKLRSLAMQADMHFCHSDEKQPKDGPTIKMIIPFLYKDQPVHWIESKPTFGDPETHYFHIENQLASYCNRFGPGIVLYWFGLHEDTATMKNNSIGITVLCDFPEMEGLSFLNVNVPPTKEVKTNFK